MKIEGYRQFLRHHGNILIFVPEAEQGEPGMDGFLNFIAKIREHPFQQSLNFYRISDVNYRYAKTFLRKRIKTSTAPRFPYYEWEEIEPLVEVV